MIEEILPPAVSAADTFEDAQGVVLFPEEEAAISRAVDKRRREFTTARACARQALARLGVPAAPIVPGERGAPQWPPGVVGSMTHCCGYRASAVARACDMATIGLDAEPDDALPDGVLDAIAVDGERAMLARLMAGTPQVCFDRLLFSAKESVYKAWFPLTGRWLGFKEAAIAISPADGTFTASLLVPGPVVDGIPLTGFAGRWMARNGLVITAIAVPAAGRSSSSAPAALLHMRGARTTILLKDHARPAPTAIHLPERSPAAAPDGSDSCGTVCLTRCGKSACRYAPILHDYASRSSHRANRVEHLKGIYKTRSYAISDLIAY